MIYTVTLNPSIDHVIEMNELQEGIVNKVNIENFYAGGKGINVSKILKEHGVENIALGFISGFTGEFIKNNLEQCGIKNDFINVLNGYSRINMKIKTNENETEINGLGPSISSSNIKDLFNQLEKLSSNDILVLAGSIPPSLSDNFYEEIMKQLSTKNVKIIVDARNNLLLNVLKYRPFLIKPNHNEISEIFNKEIKTIDELIFHGNKLKEMGAQNVLISMGGDGAILITESNEIYRSNIPKGTLKNSVGSGDSMVGGFITGYLKTNDYKEALKLGAASGSATAYSDDLAKISFINELSSQIQITKL
ncbi:1-phosphofructokinase [Candidatus Arthromitus sp. SFB-turkey]|uniref:1-phosphofructokinase n=1 Tax=Candidatus Arthromitus sp. SFB-turkey TaxID=1840217 RepID=UPI0007F37564|nr:1-phosphofructokinase [Candidatus Arthromitus sp. SFB-turkey]OAT87869.1 1-phosphofructokinase [Candidatus Arthromitus sp. SFB-turkey]